MTGDAGIRPGIPLPLGGLGALLLAVWIEVAFFHNSLAFQSSHAASWRFGADRAKRSVRECDILCFGDSLVKHGLVPDVLSRETGLRAYNLALFGGPPAASCFLLRRALEAGSRPSVVIVDFGADFLSLEPRDARRAYPWADLLSLSETVELCWRAGDADLFAKITLARLFHSVKNRHEVRETIVRYLQGRGEKYFGETLVLYRNWTKNRGAMLYSRIAGPDVPLPASAKPSAPTWKCLPPNEHYVKEFLDLTHRHGIRVYWLRPPITPGEQVRQDLAGNDERLQAFIRGLLRQFPHAVCVDGQHSGYAREAFCDNVHLNTPGALALSADMAHLILGVPTGAPSEGRWMALPRYGPPARLAAVEDLGQSTVAVRTKMRATRR